MTTQRPPMAPEQRTTKVDALMERLSTAISAVTEGDAWVAMLRASTRFHRYSFRNMMLLAQQAEERDMPLSAVAGFTTWKQLGRSVRKGEHGLQILAPVTRRADVTSTGTPTSAAAEPDQPHSGGRVMRGVRVVHVFDISQTDGAPIPQLPEPIALTGAAVPGLWDALTVLVQAAGYEVHRVPDSGMREGWTNHTTRIVSVRPDLDGAAAEAVLAHELGHVRADHEHREISHAQRETEAESISYVVMAAHGYVATSSAAPYIAGWSGGDPSVLAEAANTVHTTASVILTDLAAAGTLPELPTPPAAARTTAAVRTSRGGRAAIPHRPTMPGTAPSGPVAGSAS
ncbi:ArdC-like ssDNA-binding domain-containing protein [Pseudonocardia sp. GCM10023141]|uniref:ArdC-like ssDNA-binding domain-containing protein n=1 Tax=Pseudonocardia sp. GCM10023141 TaxID=3252653 RepID=UPI00360D3A9E